ncbi:hypothetical protein [Alkalihalobacillus pseudalcaliphilus]|uniref:hypothetical protein n=1 Tax=Alkalihalobacillus pseudalcaliphilus TaxID=79884 RepID=UPI00064DF259|nr:hypothetical protein [Alkalihalobacillus pseudalcaliphilus]KMK75190.1 hypothetical protein AB990_17290 [Alkalihalobacillus pseudalcaliphilus]
MKKLIMVFIITSLTLMITACGTNEDTPTEEVAGDGEPSSEEVETNDELEEENTAQNEETEADSDEGSEVFTTSSNNSSSAKDESSTDSSGEATELNTNLLDSDKVFKHMDDSIVMTLKEAKFTTSYEPSNGDGSNVRNAPSSSEVYLLLTGTINNDTTSSVSFGNVLGPINFSLTYDGKHEFENIASSENNEGTDFTGSSIDALTEGNIYVRFQVPLPVAENSDKPLVLTVIMDGEEFEIPLR